MSEKCENKTKLTLINGRVMTFSADDYLTLRNDHRIVGKLIGVAVSHPRNVNLSHLPAIYSEYETKLLLEEKIVILEEKLDITKKPTEQMRSDFERQQREVIEELHKPYIDGKLKSVRNNMDQIIKGKRKKLIKSGVKEEDINIKEEDIITEEENKLKLTMNPKASYSQIPTQYPFHSQVRAITDYPVRNEAKYKIFKDLWLKKNFITDGESFGGDFLTYPSDPGLFHAAQIIHIIDRDKEFDHHFISSCNRVAVSVKKKCVFAYLDEHGDVVYQTLEWINPKLRDLYSKNTSQQQTEVDSEEDDP